MEEPTRSLFRLSVTEYAAWWGAIVVTLVLIWNIYIWIKHGEKNMKQTKSKTKNIDPDVLWKQYELNINLFKSYLEFTLKLNLFYYLITGAILSFYFTHLDTRFINYSLVLPILMSFAFCALSIYGADRAKLTRKEIFRIKNAFKLEVAPEAQVLIFVLWIFAGLFLVVGLGLSYILIKNPFEACHPQ
jgi:hypothetical protein